MGARSQRAAYTILRTWDLNLQQHSERASSSCYGHSHINRNTRQDK